MAAPHGEERAGHHEQFKYLSRDLKTILVLVGITALIYVGIYLYDLKTDNLAVVAKNLLNIILGK